MAKAKGVPRCEYLCVHQEVVGRVNREMPEEELLLEANKWELAHGGLSGRCAQQFIDHLLGKGGGSCQ